ncbi:MAG TPA: serine/threonine-protein kinase [Polyangiaceae bacterium]|nr:serine/threonine-protein kinase [Polyangiaceae bacterium]
MLHRPSFAGTETTVSRLKSLYLYVRDAHGAGEADDLLARLELSSSDLANETRPVSMALWLAALEAFAGKYGKEALAETWRGVIHPDNLGVWMRVLRGVTSPEGAFRQLDGLGSEEVRTGRWETMDCSTGHWRGRVYLTHDPRFEREGLLSLARAAELKGVPALFGLGPGNVKLLTNERHTFASRTNSAFQEYVVDWQAEPVRGRERIWVALGAATVGATAGLITPALGLLGALGGAAAGAFGVERARKAKLEALAQEGQRVRLAALERGTQLREVPQNKGTVRYEEGSVVAGAYRLGAQLGSGANGVIHAAVRLSDQTPVAIKLLRLAVAHDAVASDRLRREAEAMGLAWHPNVVELYDHGMLPDGTAYLVMELLRGESLASRLQRQGKLTSEELLPIALSLCDALGAVHAAGVIHRDLKPSNIFLVDKGQDKPTAVKVLDFGIARVEWAETRITMAGAPVGTPGYMSPEQEGGREGSVDARTDIYALGAVLHECLTGETPKLPEEPEGAPVRTFTPASGIQRAMPAGAGDYWPAKLRAAMAGHPHEPVWQSVLRGALAREPRDRFVDARALKKAIAPLDPTAAESPDEGGVAKSG